jgi:hypothetical protein
MIEDEDPHTSQVIDEFESKIENFIADLFNGYSPSTEAGRDKVINDPVWGNIFFLPYEMKLLDSPILQRLRRITQVGRVDLVYPSTRHSRF